MLTYHDYAEMARSSLDEIARDCETDVFHAHGPGGQGVNTTDSAVRMRHLPTGIVVVSSQRRRLKAKRERSEIKQSRRRITGDE